MGGTYVERAPLGSPKPSYEKVLLWNRGQPHPIPTPRPHPFCPILRIRPTQPQSAAGRPKRCTGCRGVRPRRNTTFAPHAVCPVGPGKVAAGATSGALQDQKRGNVQCPQNGNPTGQQSKSPQHGLTQTIGPGACTHTHIPTYPHTHMHTYWPET